jgi:hypothetical protein
VAPIPELHKKPGLVYAVTDDGVELPVIDVTHPAFALAVTEPQLSALVTDFIGEAERRRRWPLFVRRLLYRLVLSRSILAAGLAQASGSFLSGLNTYVMKLGPDNLGRYAQPIDRTLAGSLPVLGMRLRLQDVATLLADGLEPRLETSRKRPCHLLNIGGGTAIDSLNALLVLQRRKPERLRGRSLRIHVFDLQAAAPSFGERALFALQAEGAPLHGLDVRLEHVPYDWSRAAETLPALLADRVPPDTIVAVSSEGGLFEYGSDDPIVANLQVLREHTPEETIVVGSVTRGDGPATHLDPPSGIVLVPRSVRQFETLAHRAGWTAARWIERPFSRQVSLRKERGDAGIETSPR